MIKKVLRMGLLLIAILSVGSLNSNIHDVSYTNASDVHRSLYKVDIGEPGGVW